RDSAENIPIAHAPAIIRYAEWLVQSGVRLGFDLAGADQRANRDIADGGVSRIGVFQREIHRVVKWSELHERGQPGCHAPRGVRKGLLVANLEHRLLRRKYAIGTLVIVKSESELFHVVGTRNPPRSLARGLDSRKQEGDQNSDDRDYH